MNRTEDLHVKAREETIDRIGRNCARCEAIVRNLSRPKE
jgi:hypothetical protein